MRIHRKHHRRAGVSIAPMPRGEPLTTADGESPRADSLTAEASPRQATPFEVIPPVPQHGAVMQRVRDLIASLAGALDEGTYTILDPLIDSWVVGWITRVEADYTEHCAVIAKHRSDVAQWQVKAGGVARHELSELDRLRSAYLASRSRLSGDPAAPALLALEPVPAPADGDAAAVEARPHIPVVRRGWAAPHLLAGRGRAVLFAAAALILAGALTDTVAFRNTIELLLPQISALLAWVMAVGATSMALVAAASLGVGLAIRRRSGHRSMVTVYCTLSVWLALGLAMFLVRWFDAGTGASSTTFGSQPAGAQTTPLIAAFFGAIYLVSGACTVFEAERLYNPEYFAFLRFRKQHRTQMEKAADAAAVLDRAQSTVDDAEGEFDREERRRDAAIRACEALGEEAKRYARILMTAMLKDPAKTYIPENRPISPQAEAPEPGAGSAPGGRVSGT